MPPRAVASAQQLRRHPLQRLALEGAEIRVRLLAFAIPMMIIAPLSARFVDQFGTKLVVAAGMALTTAGLVLLSFVQADSSYADLAWRMVVMAAGLALTMAPATDSIKGSLPLAG